MGDRFTTVIFDLDGVLVDTAELHYLSWKRLADEMGVPFDRRKNERLRGVGRMRSLEIILEDVPEKPEDLRGLTDRKNGYYREMIGKLTPEDLLPGVPGLLRALRERGVRIGLASASRNTEAVIERLRIGPALDAIVNGHDFREPKPAPDCFLICAERLGSSPGECVVLEDAQAGVEAAKAAGMYAVGVAAPGRTPLEGADLLVERAADLPLELFAAPAPNSSPNSSPES